jgi:hypothetical protein
MVTSVVPTLTIYSDRPTILDGRPRNHDAFAKNPSLFDGLDYAQVDLLFDEDF